MEPEEGTDEAAQALPLREDARALTVIGLGGSAGSIAALQTFFESVSKTSGSAYVVVLHLSPEHESHLAEVLGRVSRLPVQQVTQSVKIEPNQVYVIPPGKDLTMRDGALELRNPERPLGQRIVIDTFFRTLATAHGPQAAAIVFSGTGADGTLGIRQIKEYGGLVVVQNPDEAEFDAMPRSAIATGLVDYVLPTASMPAQIADYWATSRAMRIPEEAAPSAEQREEGADQEAALHEILTHVRLQTGHDFAFYKRATVLRRIGRRMQVNSLESLPAYRDFLRSHSGEVEDLIGDLLISVTQFFRDPEAWATLERDVIPRLFADRTDGEAEVRAWVCGCATGEEAYTLAMLLLEQAERLPNPPRVQVFATDMDAPAITHARAGIYPETIAGDLTEERLRRWFYRQDGAYQIRKEVREVVLFAHHDVLRDTPFSRLDLITCRNLLIYLNRDAQERVFRTFHFGLRPDRFVLLGPSESAEGDGLFVAANKQQRLFTRRAVPRSALYSLPVPLLLPDAPRGSELGRVAVARSESLRSNVILPDATGGEPAPSLPRALFSSPPGTGTNIVRDILPHYGPPVVVVNKEHAMVHLSGSVSDYLVLPEGEPTYDLLELIQPDLRPDLRGALFGAAQEGTEQTRIVRNVAHAPALRLSVRPVRPSAATGAPMYFVVQFERLSENVLAALRPLLAEVAPATDAMLEVEDASAKAAIEVARHLEQENAAIQRDLRLASEQYDAVTEELKASNEEMQATNEEMRSVVEELETGKEELQSVNEELSTVNYELKARVEELTTTNSDLSNFMGATDIATLFLDRFLKVKRFTSATLTLFNLIPTDIGRPLSDVTNRLEYPTLEEDAKKVLARLIPVEREITTTDRQRHLLVRLLPYRSLDDRIEGVVVTFVDISARRQAEETRRKSEERLQAAIDIETVGVLFFNNDFEITDCNDAFVQMSGYTRKELKTGRFSWDVFTPDDFVEVSRRALEELSTSGIATPYEKEYIRKDGSRFWAVFAAKRISETEIVEFITDITQQKRAEEAVRQSEERLRGVLESMTEGFALLGSDFTILEVNEETLRLDGRSRDELVGRSHWEAFPGTEDSPVGKVFQRVARERTPGALEHEYHWPDGRSMWIDMRVYPIQEAGVAIFWRDITDRKRAEEALRQSEEQFRRAIEEAPIPVIMHAEDGEVLQLSRSWTELTGYTLEDRHILQTWLTQAYGFGGEEVREAMERSFVPLVGGAMRAVIFDITTRQGEQRTWSFSASTPGTLRDGRRFVVSMAEDITERKQAEEALRVNEERFRLLVEGAKDYAMFLLDLESRITFWSTGAERVFGWSEAEALGQSGDIIFTPQDQQNGAPEQEVGKALTAGRAPDRRWHLRKDRSLFWADGVLMRLDDEAGNPRGFAKVARDATVEKHAEVATQAALEAVAQANADLEQRVEERTHELSEMSAMRQELLRQLVTAQEEERGRISRDLHDDTGQQLASLLMSLGNLKSHPGFSEDPEAWQYLDQAHALAEEVARKSHRLSFTLRPTVLDDLGLLGALQNYVEVWTGWSRVPAQVESIGLEQGIRLPAELETTIYRVVQEALTNILKHAASPDISEAERASKISVLVQRREREVLTIVEDNGPGFDVKAALSRPPGLRRLGIFGMQERARLVGGTLEVESVLGGGTTVYLRLPLPLSPD